MKRYGLINKNGHFGFPPLRYNYEYNEKNMDPSNYLLVSKGRGCEQIITTYTY